MARLSTNVAIREWEWCRDNPVCRVPMGKVNNARVRYCDDETLAKIYQACPVSSPVKETVSMENFGLLTLVP